MAARIPRPALDLVIPMYAVAKAPITIMPSIPTLSTPDFSATASPSAAITIGTIDWIPITKKARTSASLSIDVLRVSELDDLGHHQHDHARENHNPPHPR